MSPIEFRYSLVSQSNLSFRAYSKKNEFPFREMSHRRRRADEQDLLSPHTPDEHRKRKINRNKLCTPSSSFSSQLRAAAANTPPQSSFRNQQQKPTHFSTQFLHLAGSCWDFLQFKAYNPRLILRLPFVVDVVVVVVGETHLHFFPSSSSADQRDACHETSCFFCI